MVYQPHRDPEMDPEDASTYTDTGNRCPALQQNNSLRVVAKVLLQAASKLVSEHTGVKTRRHVVAVFPT